MEEATKQVKQAQKDFLEALKAFPAPAGVTVSMCDVYKNGFDAGKIAGQKKGA